MITQKELDYISSNINLNVTYAEEHFVNPMEDDYRNGQITRYFVKKVNDLKIIEVSDESFDSCSDFLYQKVSLIWMLSGPRNSVYFKGILQSTGVSENNTFQLKLIEKTMPGVIDKLNNPLQFYKP